MARRRYQTGSLFLRGNNWIGRWREDVMDGAGAVRRLRRSAVIGTLKQLPTKRLARRRLDLVLGRINAPNYRPGHVVGFADFAERWKTDILCQRKPSTQRVSAWHLRAYLIPEFGPLTLDQIGSERAQGLITKLSGKIAPKTVLNVIGTLSAILNTAKDWGYVADPLEWRRLTFPPRRERKASRFFTAEQARQIIAAAAEPWGTMFAMAAMTGMRAGELLALKVTDLDLERGSVAVRRSVWYGHVHAPKSLASERVLPLPRVLVDRLRQFLKTWKPNEKAYLFATCKGNPIPIQHVVQRKLWPILGDLRIPRCGLHAFRHTHSSLLIEAGAPMTVARDQLGHTDMRLTLGVYSHVVGNERRAAIEKLAGQLDPNGPMPEVNSGWVQ